MSDRIEKDGEETRTEAAALPEDGAEELRDDELEEASGGVIEGGCVRLPWEPTRPLQL